MSQHRETIVLVHGLWMKGPVFLVEGHWLEEEGFAVRTFSYPSVGAGIAANARALAAFLGSLGTPGAHLVGHSLGGLVILEMLAREADLPVGRAVLMGSPCNGSHCAAALLARRGLARLAGKSLRDWLARPRLSLPPGVEVGTIAGTRSIGLGRLVPGLPRPNDGAVSLEETRLPGARDAIALPVAHAQMLVSRECARQVAAFLRTGRFDHG